MSNNRIIEKYLPDLKELVNGDKYFCHLKTGITEPYLPKTPFRGLNKIYQIIFPSLDFNLDTLIWELSNYIGGKSFNLQHNIDAFDTLLWSPPLYFHFDRGAKYTILGALRGAANKFTFLLPINHIISGINDKLLVSALMEPVFFSKADVKKFFPLISLEQNRFRLSDSLIEEHLEFADIGTFDQCGFNAFASFLNIVEYFNQQISNTETKSFDNPMMQKILLEDGDILVINNSLTLHGRNAECLTDIDKNRWLRTMFIE